MALVVPTHQILLNSMSLRDVTSEPATIAE